METYPNGDYLPANYQTLPMTMQCAVCGRISCAVTLIRETETRYFCGVSHDPQGTCVFHFTIRCVRHDEARQIQFTFTDKNGTPYTEHSATWTEND